ncbi:MAG: hypothetical protein QM756_17025 [Polyangiaceae bacterium]
MVKLPGSGASSFVSKSSLKTGAERFLSQVVAHSLDSSARTAEDFLRVFPPLDLMRGLDAAPDLRGSILTKAVGFHERIARKKSAESAAEDLRIALDEGVTSAADILSLISADDRVTYLDRARLFAFAIEDGFFSKGSSDSTTEAMLFLLETALGEDVLALADIGDGLSFDAISRALPAEELQRVVAAALDFGRRGEPLTEERLLEIVPLSTLVRHIPLEAFWKQVVLAKVAAPAGWAGAVSVPPSKESTPPKEQAKSEPPKEAKPASGPKPAAPPKPQVRPANGKPGASSNPEVDSLLEGENKDAEEDTARRRVLDRLTNINRLPPRHPDLSTQILFSIDSMYADLTAASNDDDREEAIRDAFPNEQHMATALLALIELLEPSIDVKDPEIAKADVDSLINVFLIEERDHRERNASGSQRPVAAPVAAIAGAPPLPPARRTVPPPLPRGGSPLPPPLPSADKAR